MTSLEPYWMKDYALERSTRSTFEYIGKKSLADRLVFLHESWLSLDQDYKFLSDQISQAVKQSQRFPVLCLSSNHHLCDKIKQVLDLTLGDENYFILVADPQHDSGQNTAAWPQFLITLNEFENLQENQPKKHRISYLSGGLRLHRLQLWDAIKPHVTDQDVVVINRFGLENFRNTFDHRKISVEHAQAQLNSWYKHLPWSNHPDLIDNLDQTVYNAADPWHNYHPAYAAMINITGETLTDYDMMITEKTWKAYRSGCLVVNFGPTDSPLYLKQMGLEIWQEYDPCVHYLDKIALIKQLFQRSDIDDLFFQHKQMIQHNQNLVNSMSFIIQQTQPAVEKLQALL